MNRLNIKRDKCKYIHYYSVDRFGKFPKKCRDDDFIYFHICVIITDNMLQLIRWRMCEAACGDEAAYGGESAYGGEAAYGDEAAYGGEAAHGGEAAYNANTINLINYNIPNFDKYSFKIIKKVFAFISVNIVPIQAKIFPKFLKSKNVSENFNRKF